MNLEKDNVKKVNINNIARSIVATIILSFMVYSIYYWITHNIFVDDPIIIIHLFGYILFCILFVFSAPLIFEIVYVFFYTIYKWLVSGKIVTKKFRLLNYYMDGIKSFVSKIQK